MKDYLNHIMLKRDIWAIDIGCGTGRYTKFLIELSSFVVGIDSNPTMLERVQQKFKRRKRMPLLVRGKVETLPFKGGVFDIALLLEVLEHIEDDRGGLEEVKRILTPVGKLILSTPCPPPVYPDKLHKREGYTKKEIIKLLDEVGFKVISYKFCMFLWARVMLRFAATFISIFLIPPPLLFLLWLEQFFKKPPHLIL